MGFMSILTLICVLLSYSSFPVSANEQSDLETYVVHVQLPDTHFSTSTLSEDRESLENWYRSFLPTQVTKSANEAPSLIYSYHNIFKGFAAKLTPEQVEEMEKMPGIISAQPQRILSLHTTHSQSFLRLQQNMGFWKQSNYGKGVVIGVVDTGIIPDHPSFGNQGMPPPPAKWKGKCQFNTTACNNKLIGARFFSESGDGAPMDGDGHGSHTASTAAGNFVKGADVFGNAKGTAVGVAPLAHLAIYKVCSSFCSESDILAAMDIAIDDGVDILSLSLGGNSGPFHSDNIALGAYSAMEKGIFVSCAAGNSGPGSHSLSNEAPWILTVGASSIDRSIRASAILGNNVELHGETLNQSSGLPTKKFPLIYPGMFNTDDASFEYCPFELMNNTELRGKIVVCVDGGGVPADVKGEYVKTAGAVGMIVINEQDYGYTITAHAHVLPATHLSYVDGLKVLDYINSTKSPIASISFRGTVIGNDKHAPTVAGFSSRGPSIASPGILKPDIVGPGVNILAAWPLSVENKTNTKSNYNIISGTSMATPHLSGIAALLKSVHPDWSPAAIKSAIMTTADAVNLAGNTIEDESLLPANPFAMGSGHVNPAKASNPGLVYDLKPNDYIPYLCGLNYTDRQIGKIIQKKFTCRSRIAEAQLNYPSFSIVFGAPLQTYTRTVTNVGTTSSSYNVEVVPPPGVDVKVQPQTLKFSRLNQKQTYKVTFRRLTNTTSGDNTPSHGYLRWLSGNYSVKSPIAVVLEESIRFD